MSTEHSVALNIRLPAELHAALALRAQERGQSLQKEIVGALQASLSDGPSLPLHEEVRRLKDIAAQLRVRVDVLETRGFGVHEPGVELPRLVGVSAHSFRVMWYGYLIRVEPSASLVEVEDMTVAMTMDREEASG